MSSEFSWIEINAFQLNKNISLVKQAYGKDIKVGAMLKANAYGHGLIEVSEILHDTVDIIYVIEVEDALKIRELERKKKLGKIRVLVVGPISESDVKILIENDIEFTLIDKSFLKWDKCIFEGDKTANVHIFLDTGLGREGIRWNNIECINEITSFKNLKLKGIMTHFSDAEREGPPEYAKKQLKRYHIGVESIKKIIHDKDIELHTAASVPSLLYPEACLDSTRLGIVLYGYWTSIESKLGAKKLHGDNYPNVQPVLTWKSISKNLKLIPKGDYIGYDCAYLCEKDTMVATFPIGYYDGYPCLYNTTAWVLIDGVRCPIIGNVMMNCIVVDISNIDINGRDCLEAVIIGKSGEQYIDADLIASWVGSTNYHIITSLASHIKRKIIYTEEV